MKTGGAYRSAKKAPYIRSIAVAATGVTQQNALNAQIGPPSSPNANASEMLLNPTQADGDVEIIDVFTGVNGTSLFFKGMDGSVTSLGIPLAASFFYSFQVTGCYSLIFVGALASTVTIAIWKQEDFEPTWAPAAVVESMDRLIQKLDRLFPDSVGLEQT